MRRVVIGNVRISGKFVNERDEYDNEGEKRDNPNPRVHIQINSQDDSEAQFYNLHFVTSLEDEKSFALLESGQLVLELPDNHVLIDPNSTGDIVPPGIDPEVWNV